MVYEATYAVGDVVQIRKPDKCVFGWTHEMDRYCGKEAEITAVTTKRVFNGDIHPLYRIDSDDGHWAWSEACFDPIPEDISPVDTDISELYPWLTT